MKPSSLLISILIMMIFMPAQAEQPATASPFTEYTELQEYAVVVLPDDVFPKRLYASKDKPIKIWIANACAANVKFGLNLNQMVVIQPGKIGDLLLANGLTESAVIDAQCSNRQEAIQLRLDTRPKEQPAEFVILAAHKAFFPLTTTVPAGQPVTIGLYSSVPLPHTNFELFQTGVKLPFKNRELVKVDIPKGLKKGKYLISRPGYPKQNHKISSTVVFVE